MFGGLLAAAMHSKPNYLCVTVVARILWAVMAPGDIRLRQWCSSCVCSITSRIFVNGDLFRCYRFFWVGTKAYGNHQ